jgi:hypothetical protein
MVSSGMLRRVALVRADVSEKLSASFIRVTRIDELETTLALTSNGRTLLLVTASVVSSLPILVTLIKEALSSTESWVLTRATRHNISEEKKINVRLDTKLFLCPWFCTVRETLSYTKRRPDI